MLKKFKEGTSIIGWFIALAALFGIFLSLFALIGNWKEWEESIVMLGICTITFIVFIKYNSMSQEFKFVLFLLMGYLITLSIGFPYILEEEKRWFTFPIWLFISIICWWIVHASSNEPDGR